MSAVYRKIDRRKDIDGANGKRNQIKEGGGDYSRPCLLIQNHIIKSGFRQDFEIASL